MFFMHINLREACKFHDKTETDVSTQKTARMKIEMCILRACKFSVTLP
jgi:hypothetical protein